MVFKPGLLYISEDTNLQYLIRRFEKAGTSWEETMSTEPDDLDKLLIDIRKSIDDNKIFLKTLIDDATEGGCEPDEEEDKESEAFEEL